MNAEFLMLVDKVKTVAIPDIGAVVKMGKKYTFNHFLKFNDGRFSKHIQETGISKEEADQKVVEWASSIKESLQSQGSYVFEGMGALYFEGDGKYRWEQEIISKKSSLENTIKEEQKEEIINTVNEIEEEPSLNVVLPQYESGYLSTHFDVTRAKDEIKRIDNIEELTEFTKNDKRATIISAVEKQKKKLNEILKPSIQAEVDVKEKEKEKEEPLDKEVKDQVENESKILETIIEKEAVEKENEVKENIITEAPPKFKLDNQKEEKQEEETIVPQTNDKIKPANQEKAPPRKKRKLFLVAMLLIISGTVIIGVIKYDQFKQYFFSKVKDTKEEIADKSEALKSDTKDDVDLDMVIEKDDSSSNDEELDENKETIVNSSDNESTDINETNNDIISENITTNNNVDENINNDSFHIIVGSFTVESNADNFLATKLKEGYSNSAVFSGPKNKFYVKINSYTSKSEAIKALSGYDVDAWILKF